MALSREDMLRELELLPMWHLSPRFVVKPLSENTIGENSSESLRAEGVNIATPDEENLVPINVLDVEVELNPKQVEVVQSQLNVDINVHDGDVLPTLTNVSRPDLETEQSQSTMPQAEAFAPEMLDDPILHASMTLSEGRREKIKTLSWEELQDCVQNCHACGLAKTRKQTVFGVGDPQADWLFVGEAPGAEEDRRGEPFVGAAGQLLENMLSAIQLKRGQNVYIANVLKCRPPENRDPHCEEVQLCDPFLKRQVELIQPKLIVALGKFAAQSLLNTTESIAQLRGQLQHYHGVPVIVTYHPAYLLRNLPDKAKAWEDLCRARAMMQALQIAKTSQ